MIEYRYEELTSEEKRLIHHVQHNPLLTDTTIFWEKEKYNVHRITQGRLNKLCKILFIFIIISNSITFLSNIRSLFLYLLYFLCIIATFLILFSLRKLSKLNFDEGNPKFQKEVHLLNVHACKRVLLRNRESVEAQILKDAPRYLRIYIKNRTRVSQHKFSFLKRKKFKLPKKYILKIVSMNGYYYMFVRWNFGKIIHIRFDEQEFKKLDLEYRERNTEEIGMSEVSEERYYQLVEESKDEPLELKSYTKYIHIYYYSMLCVLYFLLVFLGVLI